MGESAPQQEAKSLEYVVIDSFGYPIGCGTLDRVYDVLVWRDVVYIAQAQRARSGHVVYKRASVAHLYREDRPPQQTWIQVENP